MGLFADSADYECFLRILERAREEISMRICGYCVMPNHWHLALWPSEDNSVQRFAYRLTSEHVRVWRKRWETAGHVYQGRYRAFAVSTDDYYLTLLRYVERNPVRAKLVTLAQDWRWSSAHQRCPTERRPLVTLDQGPVALPRGWLESINREDSEDRTKRLKLSLARSRPFGSDEWVQNVAVETGLGQLLKPPRGTFPESE